MKKILEKKKKEKKRGRRAGMREERLSHFIGLVYLAVFGKNSVITELTAVIYLS